MTLGRPGDTAGQLAVLRATLQAMEAMVEPGAVVYLPFEWTSTEKLALGPPALPPIRAVPDAASLGCAAIPEPDAAHERRLIASSACGNHGRRNS